MIRCDPVHIRLLVFGIGGIYKQFLCKVGMMVFRYFK